MASRLRTNVRLPVRKTYDDKAIAERRGLVTWGNAGYTGRPFEFA